MAEDAVGQSNKKLEEERDHAVDRIDTLKATLERVHAKYARQNQDNEANDR